MFSDDPVEYGQRNISDWLRKAAQGTVVLPKFQRSYVWNDKEKIGNYLTALLQDRPTGQFLVLKAGEHTQFNSRLLKGMEGKSVPDRVQEQILDGQQRLTSLWHSLNGTAIEKYYVRVDDFDADPVTVETVEWPEKSVDGRAWEDPKTAYGKRVIPLEILKDPKLLDPGERPIWNWCRGALPDDADAARALEDIIIGIRQEFLNNRYIRFCALPARTPREEAIDIFVQSNQSSVKVTEFDIVVALATDGSEGEEDLRDRIATFNEESQITRYYVPSRDDNPEAAIAPLGTWMLFAGCLTELEIAPKKQRFEDLINKILKDDNARLQEWLNGLLSAVETSLGKHAELGAPTRSTLPTFPPVHVLAGLNEKLKEFYRAKPSSLQQRLTDKLITAYIWRAFCTNRYDARANDRLFKDFQGLKQCLQEIANTGRFNKDSLPPIFTEEYPIPDRTTLAQLDEDKALRWIGSTDHLGRAVASLTLHRGATDWATGQKLTQAHVRNLEGRRALHRHHVFPKALLQKHGFKRGQINHGLNGVLLSESTNKSFSKADPHDYLTALLDEPYCPSRKELRTWVESHLVPYDVIMADDPVEKRYPRFIRERARLVEAELNTLTTLPI